jgi:hypothetical protein
MKNERTAWVAWDGTYGEDDLLLYHPDALTDEQTNFMHNLPDIDRYDYVKAILEGNLNSVAKLHHEYEDEEGL